MRAVEWCDERSGPGRKGAAATRATAVVPSVHADAYGDRLLTLKDDGTADCETCGLPLFPYARAGRTVRLECANHHHAEAPLPADQRTLLSVDNWIAKRGAQLHAQHERWGTDDLEERDRRNV